MTVTTNERGQNNLFAKEPRIEVMEVTVTHNERAEQLNGRLAMLGVIAAHWRLLCKWPVNPRRILSPRMFTRYFIIKMSGKYKLCPVVTQRVPKRRW